MSVATPCGSHRCLDASSCRIHGLGVSRELEPSCCVMILLYIAMCSGGNGVHGEGGHAWSSQEQPPPPSMEGLTYTRLAW